MPRTRRASQGGYCYHVLNRGNARRTVFHKDGDYVSFLKLLHQAGERTPIRLLSYCLMPNHFHLAVWPRNDGDLSDFMQWLLTAHVRRYHRHYHSTGHVWQGRFKAFPIRCVRIWSREPRIGVGPAWRRSKKVAGRRWTHGQSDAQRNG